MLDYNDYEDIDDLDGRRRKALEGLMFDDEQFLYAIDVKEGRVRSKTNEKLVLTDSRIIAFKKGVVNLSSEDYSLGDVSSVKFDSGMMSAEITLQGSGIDDEFEVAKDMGQDFVNRVREQIQE